MISEKNKSEFNKTRTVMEQDLTSTIGKILGDNISSSAESAFVVDKSIMSVKDKIHSVQMIMVNKWFRELLLIAKSYNTSLHITDVLMCIEDNLPPADWVKLYTVAVIPYIRKNNILR